jgi:hypothetical protein
MSVPRIKLADNFTIVSNTCINDDRLGFEALAIFMHLRSKPVDWIVRPNEIATRFKAGRDRVRKALNQLVECGYVGKVQTRDPATGRLGPVDYVVRALPEASPSTETPSTENPSTVIRSLQRTDTLQRTDSTKNNTIPDLRSGVSSAEEADATRAIKGDVGKVEASTVTGKPLPRDHQPKAPYRQSAEAAKRALAELKDLPWPTEFCGGIDHGSDFKGLNDRSARGAKFHWKRLLREECSADDIVATAKRFMRQTPEHLWPSIGGFLARFESYLEDVVASQATDQPAAMNDLFGDDRSKEVATDEVSKPVAYLINSAGMSFNQYVEAFIRALWTSRSRTDVADFIDLNMRGLNKVEAKYPEGDARIREACDEVLDSLRRPSTVDKIVVLNEEVADPIERRRQAVEAAANRDGFGERRREAKQLRREAKDSRPPRSFLDIFEQERQRDRAAMQRRRDEEMMLRKAEREAQNERDRQAHAAFIAGGGRRPKAQQVAA